MTEQDSTQLKAFYDDKAEINPDRDIATTKTYNKNDQDPATTTIEIPSIYAPTVNISYTPRQKAAVSAIISHKDLFTGKETRFENPVINFDAKTQSYKIVAKTIADPSTSTFDTTAEYILSKLADDQKENGKAILDQLKTALNDIPATQYKNAIEYIDNLPIAKTIEQRYKTAYNAIKKNLLAPTPTGIEAFVIEFRPSDHQIKTRTIYTMSQGAPQPIDSPLYIAS